ncbi:uncharacterized protein LOC108909821 [Anoplophora glabripennis]|uniref:uncharacterized protein LOC108909821 n=1 Tax=Anoplophora glabripennis TaxID=217634 RepID=UPI0008748FE1|nr:uncharacterized protein LOC108909821 [Anoplophora glabripennis]
MMTQPYFCKLLRMMRIIPKIIKRTGVTINQKILRNLYIQNYYQSKKNESSSRKVPLNETTATDDNLFSTAHWTSRNRPVISTLASSELSKKYNKLAELKIELVQVELDRLKAEQEIKKERDLVEFELRRKFLELDLKIKHIFLEKMGSEVNPFSFNFNS